MNEPAQAAPHPSTPLPATTTLQQDIVTAGQRQVNLIWERTQATIAIMVVLAGMIVCVYIPIWGKPEQQIPTLLSVAFGMITGFYFSRTNHAAIGGIGKKPEQPYEGR